MKLCENSKAGHHDIYLKTLLKIKNTEEIFLDKVLESKKKKIIVYFKSRKEIINYFIAQKTDLHLLYIDNLYLYPLLKKIAKKIKILGTLHFVPENRLKQLLLKNFSKRISLIVVHSDVLKQKLLKIGIENVEVVHYPSFYDYSSTKSKEELKKQMKLEKKIILTALGGTRSDKGLDILLEAFKYLNSELKEKIVLNIAGKEEAFKKDFIAQKSKENKINTREKYGFLTDEEFMENVLLTDIMVLPYRKKFGGNSGPMTEAIVNKIPCITPKGLNIGDLTEKYDLGLTFECENPKSLAETIEKIILNKEKNEFFTSDYHKKLTVENFLRSYEDIYSKLEKGEYK
ncbi:MAG: glycosyltransferase [Cetobacterium sp.]